MKSFSSYRFNDVLIKNTKPKTLHDNLLTFRDTSKVFELKGGLLKMITNKNCNVDLASLAEKILLYDFAEEMHFDVRGIGRNSTGDHTLIKLPKSPGLMASASSVSETIFFSSDPDDLCNRLTLLLQEKNPAITSKKITEKVIAILDKL